MYTNSNQPQEMQDRYKELPPEITELFEYGTVEITIEEIAKEFGLNKAQQDMLLMEVELILYLFSSREDLSKRLAESLEIEESRANGIDEYLQNNLFSIVEDILSSAEKQLNEDSVGQKTTPAEPEIATESSPSGYIAKNESSTPQPTEPKDDNNSSKLQGMRTFAKDVERSRAHGYGAFRSSEQDSDEEIVHKSSQEETLRKGKGSQ